MNIHRYSAITLAILIYGCSNNTAIWMQDSKIAIESKNITEIVIPGSNIANAYEVDNNNPICLGEINPLSYSNNGEIEDHILKESPSFVNQQLFLEELNTQNTNINIQLNQGIRYLDIHICRQNNEFYTSNLYLTDTFEDIADQIKSFLIDHPSEIVILDLDNNLRAEYGYLNEEDIKKFHKILFDTFGNLIIPKAESTATIGELQIKQHQLIILSSNPLLILYPDIWDKNKSALSIEAQSSTIQSLSSLEIVLNNNIPNKKLTMLPIYSNIRMENILNENQDIENNQDILFNYIEQNISNHPGIIITNKNYATSMEDLVIQNEINFNLAKLNESIAAIESSNHESNITTKSMIFESNINESSQGSPPRLI